MGALLDPLYTFEQKQKASDNGDRPMESSFEQKLTLRCADILTSLQVDQELESSLLGRGQVGCFIYSPVCTFVGVSKSVLPSI